MTPGALQFGVRSGIPLSSEESSDANPACGISLSSEKSSDANPACGIPWSREKSNDANPAFQTVEYKRSSHYTIMMLLYNNVIRILLLFIGKYY
jgi:hypothetical protein